MSRDIFDAKCNSCGKETRFLTGDTQVCPECGIYIEYQPVIGGEISTRLKEGFSVVVGKSKEIHS
jgi:hypothetical protein